MMQTKNTNQAALAVSDESLPEPTSFLNHEMPDDLHIDAGELYTIPFNYLCTVHGKLYNSSALTLLRTVFNL